MYLRTIAVENTGPIPDLRLELPFQDGRPLPVILVGPNGSGKSTLLSFVVNALVGFKQQAFEQAEIEHSKVYRVRSPQYIRTGAHWYHVRLDFGDEMSLDEWVLDRPRKAFEAEVRPLPADDGWKQIEGHRNDRFHLTPQNQNLLGRGVSEAMLGRFRENVVLFFPSDRFELPEWLNERSLAADLRFPDAVPFEGLTHRRIFSRALLKPTLEWVKALVFDQRLTEYEPIAITLHGEFPPRITQGLVQTPGKDSRVFVFVLKVLTRILGADDDTVRIQFGRRDAATIAVTYARLGKAEAVPNLLGLSAGQAALFCVFCNLIRDFDMAGAAFADIADIRGIVLLDEADLHLHVDLQYRVLPELMKLFPKVQFVLTAHAPLLVMGVESAFGADGFRVIAMPSGDAIESEAFSEFSHALSAFSRTRAFDQRVLDRVRRAARPVVLVEGKTDVSHLETAWEKLNPGRAIPWDVVPCGGVATPGGRGGASMLKAVLEACCLHIDRPTVGLFDYDQEGVEQFRGLKACGFAPATGPTHWKHAERPVQALLLPVPAGREAFVTSGKPRSCFLAVEHYYSDAVLRTAGLADDPVVADSAVFGISADAKKKSKFVEAIRRLASPEFARFQLLFDAVTNVVGAAPDSDPNAFLPVPSYVPPMIPNGLSPNGGYVSIVSPQFCPSDMFPEMPSMAEDSGPDASPHG